MAVFVYSCKSLPSGGESCQVIDWKAANVSYCHNNTLLTGSGGGGVFLAMFYAKSIHK